MENGSIKRQSKEDEAYLCLGEFNAVAMSEIMGKSEISKIVYAKGNNFLEIQGILPLPSIIHLNIHKAGIYPVSLERAIYSFPNLDVGEKTIKVANGIKYKIIENAECFFSRTSLDKIVTSLKLFSLLTGKFIKLHFLERGDFASRLVSIPDKQLYDSVFKFIKNNMNWYVNEELLDRVESIANTKKLSIHGGILDISEEITQYEPSKLAAINYLRNEIEKLVSKKRVEYHRFRIYKINMEFKLKTKLWTEMKENFCVLIGHLEERENKLTFCDTNQLKRNIDYIPIQGFPNLERLDKNWEYILVGILKEGDNAPVVNPLGFIKTRPLKRNLELLADNSNF